MTSLTVKIITAMLIPLLFAACNKTVTNNVPGATTSTPATPGAPSGGTQTVGPKSAESGGGVINGGGGKGVRCTRGGKTTVEVLDLYEAKTLYNLSLVDFGNAEEPAKEKLAQMLARHFWSPYNIEPAKFAEYMKKTYVQELLGHVRFIDAGKSLKFTNDSYEPTLETGCEPVQIAMYYDESVLLVDKALWSQMDWTNKMGLLAHEAMYFLARQGGTTNSMSTRKLVGMMFSSKGVTPRTEGVPTDSNKFVECSFGTTGFSKGHFFLYPKHAPTGELGMEAVFEGLGDQAALFRTSAFIEGLSPFQLQSPNFKQIYEAALVKDTYAPRDRVSISFKGIVDARVDGELRFSSGVGAATSETLNMRCELPRSVDELLPNTMEAGEFETKPNTSSVEKISISSNGRIIVQQNGQVGGPGGFSRNGVVPYPTVCRFKEIGYIKLQTEESMQYTVLSGELGSLEGLKDSEHCKDYVEALNREASGRQVSYTLMKKDFTKIK